MEKKKESNFLMQGSILALAAIVTKVIGLAYRIPLTNILGDEGNGYYGVVFQVYSLALMLTSYSLPMAVSKLVSARLAKKEYINVQKVLKSALLFAVAAGGTVTLIVFFGADFIGSKILKMELSVYALRTLAPCILIVAFLGVFRGYFQGHRTMIPTAVSQILEQIANAVLSIVGAWSLLHVGLSMAEGAEKESYGAALGAAGGTIGTVTGALVALIFLIVLYVGYRKIVKKQLAHDTTRFVEKDSQIMKILLLTIAPIILSATLANVQNILDQGIFTNVLSGQGYTEKEYTSLLGLLNGQYDTLMGIPLSVSTALASSFMPSLVATIQTGSKAQIHQKMNMVSRFNMLIVIPCAAGYIALARPIMDLLFFTQDNTIPAMLLRIGAVSVIFLCLSSVTSAALQGMDKMFVPVRNAAIALVIHTIALVVMLVFFKWNVYGVVISRIIFAVISCWLNDRDLKKYCGYNQELKKTFLIPVIASVIMGIVSAAMYALLNLFLPGAVAAIFAICIAVAVYGISMIVLKGITAKDLMQMPKGHLLLKILRKMHLMKS